MKKICKVVDVYKEYNNENNILIYQMGKVGSTAIENSFPNTLHMHTLYGHSPCYVHDKQKKNTILGRVVYNSLFFLKRLAIRRRSKIKIVTLVRNPVNRDISMFFQNLAHWIYEYIGEVGVSPRDDDKKFLQKVFYSVFPFEYASEWFDREIKRFSGIDVVGRISKDFNEKGVELLEDGKYSILFIKYECLGNSEVHGALSDFFGIDADISHKNKSSEKWYSSIYREFKDDFEINDRYRDALRGNRWFNEFYGEGFIK